MSLVSFTLVVLAAFVHAGWNLLAKRAASVGPVFVFAYNFVACAVYGPWAIYRLAHDSSHWSGAGLALVALSGILHLAYSLCLQRGYHVADLSIVYPVARGTGPLLSTIGAFLILSEVPSLLGLSGLGLVVVGILMIATGGDWRAFRRPGGQAGVRWGAATGGLIASYTVVDAYAVKAIGIAPVVLDWLGNLMRFTLLAPVAARNPGRAVAAMRGHWGTAIGVGVLSPLSYILVLVALKDGAPLSLVAPMREMSMMVGALLAMLVLKERVGTGRLIGCALVVGGVALLATQ
ncbi:EamA family transporter [Sphingomonas floccifaciens]|uniref:EamA family transporter n=1 Tax=Sphingomonas floccifaciens TaxID=1844115 RepID=A0ABW4N7L7_9SPHN